MLTRTVFVLQFFSTAQFARPPLRWILPFHGSCSIFVKCLGAVQQRVMAPDAAAIFCIQNQGSTELQRQVEGSTSYHLSRSSATNMVFTT